MRLSKTIFLFAISYTFLTFTIVAQKVETGIKFNISPQTVVKDSSGQIYRYEIWKKLLLTGYYELKPENPTKPTTPFLLVRLSDKQRITRLQTSPKPQESKYFKIGELVESFSTFDINGNRIKLKELKGKVVVLNFWFINCQPCLSEILELNKIVADFKDSNIVFIAIAPDSRSELKTFLKTHTFKYAIIDNARQIIDQYGVTSYPTHLVLDKEGKVYFHTSGTGTSTLYWLRKVIEGLLAPP